MFISPFLEATFENDGNLEALLNHVLWEPTTSSTPTTEEEKVVPFFDETAPYVNLTVQIGANVDLHCKVNHLNEKTVNIKIIKQNNKIINLFLCFSIIKSKNG
jgi:hypothetical protein